MTDISAIGPKELSVQDQIEYELSTYTINSLGPIKKSLKK